MRILLQVLAFIFNLFPKTDFILLHWCRLYEKYGLKHPNLVGKDSAPTVSTDSTPSSITTSQAVFDTNNISATGGQAPTVRGICWKVGAGQTPTTADSKTTENGTFGTGNFSATASSLSAATTYSVRAYATNSVGTGYGSRVEVTTLGPPSVSTGEITSITSTSATVGGNITSVNGANATERGICYMTGVAGDPTTSDSKASDTGGSYGTGVYTKDLSDLTAEGSYRVRAYAINSYGTGYGTTSQLTLTDLPPTVALNTPTDTATNQSVTPALVFTGTDVGGDAVQYEVQIGLNATFTDIIYQNLEIYSFTEGERLNATNKKLAFSFTAQSTVTLTSVGFVTSECSSAPTYNVGIQADSSGSPSGTFLGTSGTVAGASSYQWQFVTVSVSVTAGTKYWLVIDYNTGTCGASNYMAIRYKNDNQTFTSYAGATDSNLGTYYHNGTNWASKSLRPIFMVSDGTNSYGQVFEGVFLSGIANGASKYTTIAPSTTITITGFSLYIREESGTSSAALTYELYNYTDSVSMETGTLASPGFGGLAWANVTLASPRELVAGKTYYFKYSTTAASGSAWQYYYAYLTGESTDSRLYAASAGGSQMALGVPPSLITYHQDPSKKIVGIGPIVDAFSTSLTGFTADADGIYPSGNQVTYTVQSALDNDTIYYWRVRAKDPSGSNTYGAWTTPFSFTTESYVAARRIFFIT